MDTAKAGAGGLLDQYKLLGAVLDSEWATRLDHRVARHVIDRYYPKHGNARVSLRYLEQATGSRRNKIIASLRRLCANGVFTVLRPGKGTRPTEYALNFGFAASGTSEGTSSDSASSGTLEGTPCGTQEGTPGASSGTLEGTQTYLPSTAYKPIDEYSSTVSAAPPAHALSGSAAASGFERVWKAYGKHGNKKASKEAFAAIAEPDIDLIAERAASWAASAKQGRRRMPLEKWLAQEKYDEADRRIGNGSAGKSRPPRGFRERRVTVTQVGEPNAKGSVPIWTRYHDYDEDVDGDPDNPVWHSSLDDIEACTGAKGTAMTGRSFTIWENDEGDCIYPANDSAPAAAEAA